MRTAIYYGILLRGETELLNAPLSAVPTAKVIGRPYLGPYLAPI